MTARPGAAGPLEPPGPPEPGSPAGPPGKPTVESLGLDVAALAWQPAGDSAQPLEVAFAGGPPPVWVLLRVAGDPSGRVLVYDRHEWECFLDGVRGGEFDAAGHG